MTEDKFWEYIEFVYKLPIEKVNKFGYQYTQTETIQTALKKKGAKGVIEFQQLFSEKILNLFIPKIAELFYISAYAQTKYDPKFKYISTDGFLDFRAWIVGMGKAHYYTFLNFDTEDEISQYDLNPNSAYREDLVFLAEGIYRELNEVSFPLEYFYDGDSEKLYAQMQWNQLEAKYPKIYKGYFR